ncbi:hypothetical protein BN938_2542 [Mucinivorans hirudinis]|uniref:Uncharacterized protein n=1 Tax=Mucinivorans hirudinis TaxID=1433126 RepID=A0A060RAI7_9BACT|nr:hypothetical protein BN938_2542 [Mucinivorans hirudinis]
MRKITISENGTVNVPTKVQMRDFEIAELFGVIVPTVKGKIRQILKEDVCRGDFSIGGIVVGGEVMPEYYGLDMVVAVAFRVQSHEAKVFREWVLRKMTVAQNPSPPLYLRLPHGSIAN